MDAPRGPFVSVAWLREHLDAPELRVLDTRGRIPAPGAAARSLRPEYDAGHVPGASFVVWNSCFVDPDDPVPNQLASPERVARSAARLGIDSTTIVVAYDDSRSIFAGRLWWALRAMGHDRVRVLDGGWPAWLAAGAPVETATPTVAPGSFQPRARLELRRTIDAVADRDPATVLVDARGRDRFAGTGSDPVGGHIPGAVNVPYDELVGADGHLRPDAELRAAFAAAGIDPSSPLESLVTSCGSGISASVPLLALEHLTPGAGARGAIYDGSWAEWSRSGRPIATGPSRR